jgi:putative transposase
MVAPYTIATEPWQNIGTDHLIPVTNPLERVNEEIKRRTYVVRIFPDTASCLRLLRALAVETHENWREANRYLNMDDLREQKKQASREAACHSFPPPAICRTGQTEPNFSIHFESLLLQLHPD